MKPLCFELEKPFFIKNHKGKHIVFRNTYQYYISLDSSKNRLYPSTFSIAYKLIWLKAFLKTNAYPFNGLSIERALNGLNIERALK